MTQRLYKIYQDSTAIPSNAAATYDRSENLPAGTVAQFGLRWTHSSATAVTSASFLNILQNLRIRFNGNVWLDANMLRADDADDNISRIGAFSQDCGGYVAEAISATAGECWLWFPCGVTLPANSRVEVTLGYTATAVATTGGSFEMWARYGPATQTSFYGSSTSQTLPAGSQTQVNVKVPAIPGATVAGIAVLAPDASARVTTVIPKGITDFAISELGLEGLAGITQDQYYYADPADEARYTFAKELPGYNFMPMFDMAADGGNLTLLVEDSVGGIFSFVPVLSVASAGAAGERLPMQTAGVVTRGASQAINERAE
jgi:hypothetical protein